MKSVSHHLVFLYERFQITVNNKVTKNNRVSI